MNAEEAYRDYVPDPALDRLVDECHILYLEGTLDEQKFRWLGVRAHEAGHTLGGREGYAEVQKVIQEKHDSLFRMSEHRSGLRVALQAVRALESEER